jgi:hypothetical protein
MSMKVPASPTLHVGALPISVCDQDGRYSIEEAGMMLDSETNNGGRELLMNAAAAGALKVYAPENNALFPVDQISTHRDYLEAYWDDLNVWLKANAPRIKFEFPAPASEPATTTSEPAAKGVTKAQILTAFGTILIKGKKQGTVSNAMENGYFWAVRARLAKGERGRDNSQWCPVLMAIELHERKFATKAAITKAFLVHKFLSGWRAEWMEQSEGLSQ